MKPIFLALTAFLFTTSVSLYGQILKPSKDYLKINLTALVFKNYSFQYERSVSRHVSLALGLRTMPSSSLPFKNSLIDANNNPDTKQAIEALRLKNFAATPEIRFYLSAKGFGRGFYMAPFYRYASFTASNMKFDYTNSSNTQSSIFLGGKLTANTAGILFGSQRAIGKFLCLDIWIFGPHYGSGNGNFSGIASTALTSAEQDEIRRSLNDLDIPLTKKTVTVNSSGASLKLDGPWGGIRAGLSLGVRF